MKTISIKTHPTEFERDEKNQPTEQPFTTLSLISLVMKAPPEGGFSPDEMRKRFKVLDKVEALTNESTAIELEDSEASLLSSLFKKYKWGKMDKFIVDFEDSIK